MRENENNNKKEIHPVLTYKLEKGKGCINRDKNSCLNMMKIVRSLIEEKQRPEKYKRIKKERPIPDKKGDDGVQREVHIEEKIRRKEGKIKQKERIIRAKDR